MAIEQPFSCDTSVVTPPLTANGQIIFAKNSDRAVNECQPLRYFPRATHEPGSTVHVQYLVIPQVETTWEMIGSAPWWLWGFEMGVNEWGVAIGNEAVHTREPTHDQALIGMDLVRLGLERARTAQDAVEVIGTLLEEYGQGGSCEVDRYRTYQNSFIIADPNEAWILETAGHRWVASQVHERGAISNLLTIDTPWDRSSLGVREHAETQGWWQPEGGFATAYQDPETDLTTRSCRLERARDVLGSYRPGVGIEDMMAVLRDHGPQGDLPIGSQPLPSICMHGNPAFEGETAAGMVVELRPDRPKLLSATIWTAFGSPCLSVFRPAFPALVGLPERLGIGGAAFDPVSPWWVFERLQRLVARAPGSAAFVREAFGELQNDFFTETAAAEALAERQLNADDDDAAISTLRNLVESTTQRAIALAEQLTLEFPLRSDYAVIPELDVYWNERDTKVMTAARATS